MFMHLAQFLSAVFTNWIVIMSGVVSVVFEMLSRAGRKVGPHWWWFVAALCIFISCYQAWLGEVRINEACLHGNIDQLITGDDTTKQRNVVAIELMIKNARLQPTSVGQYRLDIIGSKTVVGLRPFTTVHDLTMSTSDGTSLVFRKGEYLFDKTQKAIPVGEGQPGWLLFQYSWRTITIGHVRVAAFVFSALRRLANRCFCAR